MEKQDYHNLKIKTKHEGNAVRPRHVTIFTQLLHVLYYITHRL